MSKKIIHFKKGKITLYERRSDDSFGGTLVIKAKAEAEPKAEELDFSDFEKTFTKELEQTLEGIRPPFTTTIIAWLREYWELVDFRLLFSFISLKLKELFEFLFYSNEPPKPLKFPSLKIPEPVKSLKDKIKIPELKFNNPKLALKSAAIACLILAFASFAAFILPLVAAQIRPYIVVDTNTQAQEQKVKDDYPLAQPNNLDPSRTPSTQEFKITIPKIDLVSDISPYVDLSKELEYREELLKTGVAHAKDSYFPGEGGPVFLFAHSTDTIFNIARFNAKFFYAKDLKQGDEIDIDYGGKKYKYIISSTTIIDPKDIETVRQSASDLILMTCTPPGTDWQRLIIFADEVTTP